MNELANVTEYQGITSVKIADLTPQDLSRIANYAKSLDIMSSNSITNYGVGVLDDIAKMSTSVLTRTKSSQLNEQVNDTLKNAITAMRKASDVNKPKRSGLMGLIDKWRGQAEDRLFDIQFATQDVNAALNTMEGKLHVYIKDLENDARVLDSIKDKNREHYNELSLLLAGGEMKLYEMENAILPAMKQKADASGDLMIMQDYNELVSRKTQLERHIHNLQLTRQSVLQNAVAIAALQKADYDQKQQLQDHIMLSVPMWRKQLGLSSMLAVQAEIAGVNKAAADFTNQLMTQNAKLLNTTVSQIAEQSERGIIDVESFEAVTSEFETMIANVMNSQVEGRRRRKDAEAILNEHERRLKSAVLTASTQAIENQSPIYLTDSFRG